jgi:hypothetical protein
MHACMHARHIVFVGVTTVMINPHHTRRNQHVQHAYNMSKYPPGEVAGVQQLLYRI